MGEGPFKLPRFWDGRAEHIVPHTNSYDLISRHIYLAWYHREGMPSVWYRTNIAENLYNHQDPPTGSDPLSIRL